MFRESGPRFLRGARRINPPRLPSIPSWDLSLVLRAQQQGPFEPLQTVELKFLSMKTLLLLALASIKRVGDLHAFSVDDSFLEVILRPRPGYVPKVPTTFFKDQVVSLWALFPRPSFALSRPSVEMLRWQDAKLQDFRPALCISRRPAEEECQAEDDPLDSGRHNPGSSGTGCALPVQVASPLY